MLYELGHFVAVSREGTFTAAAAVAGLTQPALSASIQRLEAQLGGLVFDRGRHGATLTDAGQALLPHAMAALAAVEDGRRAVGEVLGLGTGRVVVAAGATAATYLLPGVLSAFRVEYPGIRARLVELATPEILEAVRRGDADLGVATRLPGDREEWKGLTEELWCTDPLVLVQRPDESRTDPPFLTFQTTSPLRTLLDRHFPGVEIAMELSSIPSIKGNVAAGAGIALVPSSAVVASIEDGRLATRPDGRTPLDRDLVLVHRGQQRLSAAGRALRNRLLPG